MANTGFNNSDAAAKVLVIKGKADKAARIEGLSADAIKQLKAVSTQADTLAKSLMALT